jgi:tetratricopeptide (TPR) repeat protein
MAPSENTDKCRPLDDLEAPPPAKRIALSLSEEEEDSEEETQVAKSFAEAQAADRLFFASSTGSAQLNEPEAQESDAESEAEAETLMEQQETLKLLAIQNYETALAVANDELLLDSETSQAKNSSEARWIKASCLLRLGTLIPLPQYLEESIQEFESLAQDYPTFASGLPDLYLSLGRAWAELFKLQVQAEDEAEDSSTKGSSSKSLSSIPSTHPLEHIHKAYCKAFDSLVTQTSLLAETAVTRIARAKDILEAVELDQTRGDEENASIVRCDGKIVEDALSWSLNLIQDIHQDSPVFDPLLRGRLMFRLGSTLEDLEWINKGIEELEGGLNGAEKVFETASEVDVESARVDFADWIYTVCILFLFTTSRMLL